jgi:hypothetical protein
MGFSPQNDLIMNKKVPDPEFCRKEEPKDLKLLELLIDKSIKRLEEDSFEPKIRDALKAIQLKQKVAKTSEAEKTFWHLIDDIRRQELSEPCPESIEPTDLEAQILNTIVGLKDQVKNGILPVKTITDTFNQGKSKESRLTYHRIGRLLSTMGFRKARTGSGASAILWDEDFIFSLCPSQNTELVICDDSKKKKPSSETSERSETSETPEAKEAPSLLEKDCQDASPGQVANPALRSLDFTRDGEHVEPLAQGGERSRTTRGGDGVLSPLLKGEGQVANPARGGGEVNRNLFLCPPSLWSQGH